MKKIWYAPNKFESYGEEEIKAVEECLRDGWLAGFGPKSIKFEKGIVICDENEPIYKLKVFTRKNNKTFIYKLELPEIDLSEPLFNLIKYVSKSIKTNSNSIFKNNFNHDITNVLEKI